MKVIKTKKITIYQYKLMQHDIIIQKQFNSKNYQIIVFDEVIQKFYKTFLKNLQIQRDK